MPFTFVRKLPLALLGLLACGDASSSSSSADDALHAAPVSAPLPAVKTVFMILLENHNWSDIHGSSSAPFLNGTLLSEGAHAENYFNAPGLHPSEPNYIWLEAGDNLGITTDADPSKTHSLPVGTDHLTKQLANAGKSWRAYEEGIRAGTCPVKSSGLYAAKHNPMVFFQDVSGSPPSATNAGCIANERPFDELASDLAANKAADYNFLTPNLCDDSHGASGCPSDLIRTSDDWLARVVPMITASAQYKAGGAIFITYDESEHGEHPIGMIVLSPFVTAGKISNVRLDHSSTLATVEQIFGVPKLRAAATAPTLSDLFAP